MKRFVVLLLSAAALIGTTPAQARYLHTADAVRVVTHEQQAAVRHGEIGGFKILHAKRYNAHGVLVWVRSTQVDAGPSQAPFIDATGFEIVRLYPNGFATSHLGGFDYFYRERLR